MKSAIARGYLRHLREHYSISLEVQMRVPLEGETVDAPLEEGFTPIFWEFLNYGLRLRASPFVNSLLFCDRTCPRSAGSFRMGDSDYIPNRMLIRRIGAQREPFCKDFQRFHQGRVLGSKAPQSISSSSKGKTEESTSDQGVKDMPKDVEAPKPKKSPSILRQCTASGKLKSEVDLLKENSQKATLDSEKIKAKLSETRSLLEDCLAEKENLNSRLFLAENSAASAIEDFKGSSEYVELLKGNTTTLLRDFCQKVSSDFPGISSHFQEYVSGLGEDYVVDLFHDNPDEDDEDVGIEEGDSEPSDGDEDIE
ncbi:hypothetical protein LIER_29474 [Lithospermum erythrorhizon]|uniref:Uncharacterized protein n=1 Tax=Lithospermum erythrorhizon TaxID=34254 RepID=A0AAV3RNB5_LITER